jgi:hypothetical protein
MASSRSGKRVNGNSAGGYGGGIYQKFGSLTVTNSTVADNSVGHHVLIATFTTTIPTLTVSDFAIV